MSDLNRSLQTLNGKQTPNVDHSFKLCDDISGLLNRMDLSDIVLVVEGHNFFAHKAILAARSEYFRALLFGGLRESQPGTQEIVLHHITAESFRICLQYIYTGKCYLNEVKIEPMLELLRLVDEYGFTELQLAICEYIKNHQSVQDVCMVFDGISQVQFPLGSLHQDCLRFMDSNADDIMKTDGFLNLSPASLKEIICRDSFAASEISIFNGVSQWFRRNAFLDNADVKQQTMLAIRFQLMSIDDLLDVVWPSSLVELETILAAIKMQYKAKSTQQLPYRGMKLPEENIAVPQRAAVIRGELRNFLLDGDYMSFDLDRGYTRHPIDANGGKGIVVRLDRPYIINAIKMLLWDKDARSYSYVVSVSMDDQDYRPVVDYQKYLCRSWQNLRFAPTVCQFIHILGTHNTMNRIFHLVHFGAYYTEQPFTLVDSVIVPEQNVATIEASATVVEGVSRNRNALINGDTVNYDWDTGYTCHQLGSGAIVVQLAQPYFVGSLRMLLWDCDERFYSYLVEVSIDNEHWTRVCDRSDQDCQSWQVVTFDAQPVSFIKIVGTRNTANEVFHMVHIEMPAHAASLADADGRRTSATDVPKAQVLEQPAGVAEPSATGYADAWPRRAGAAQPAFARPLDHAPRLADLAMAFPPLAIGPPRLAAPHIWPRSPADTDSASDPLL